MTHRVLRSGVDPDAFRRAVEAHAAELAAWNAHAMAAMAGDAQHYPPPTAHPDVDAAVRRDKQPDGSVRLAVDYELVDRHPVARDDHRGLAVRKAEHEQQLLQMEQRDLHALLPRGKWRLAALEHEEAAATPEDERTAEHHAAMARHKDLSDAARRVHLHYARQHAELEDVGFDEVNDWRPRDLPGSKP